MSETLIGKRIAVLDQGFLELQDVMPHPAAGVSPDTAIASAARVSFMGESKGDEKDAKLIHYLMKHAHTSPFEMVEFKFRVKAPLITYWQWIRHRTFAYQSVNSQSGRYTEFDEDEFYIPAVWRRQSPSNKQASLGEVETAEGEELTRDLIAFYKEGFSLYEKALAAGVSREMARLFLPAFAVYYTWIVKVDLHNLFGFLRLRMAGDAQYEIRAYAEAMYYEFVKPLAPVASAAFEDYILKPNGIAVHTA
ncbi:MAG TPA: FAD-dependent thymidylate synthase [Aggregatilineales bacterium]|nr:FAD-dependent thymidylate synthase [Anaerolineales bacterium]HRE48430.1 FAD-dependent thymidylate synthase [Aggregatilineales bacterium]